MRMVLNSPATPILPISILSLPVVRVAPAELPTAILLLPVVLLESARAPMAVLKLPVVLFKSVSKPMAVLSRPLALLISALSPRTVLLLGRQPCWQVALAIGEKAKQARAGGMNNRVRLFVFIMPEILPLLLPHSNDKVI